MKKDSATVRNELRKIAATIESLARVTATKLQNGESAIDASNELVCNAILLSFSFGELFTYENLEADNSLLVSKPTISKTQTNWHNVRDSRGRFVRAVRP